MAKPRLQELYVDVIRPRLKEQLEFKNIMETPKLSKIVLNVGVKEAVGDSRVLGHITQTLASIAGQAPVKTDARKSIASFKLREGVQIGAMVTLRGDTMYAFLDKLINLALPKVRDFHGVPLRLDGRGNYNLGIKDCTIFPEAESLNADKSFGMNITIQTTACEDEHGRELLKSFGMPFRKS